MRGFWWGLIKTVLWIGVPCAIALGVLRMWYVRTAVISHNAMAPTLLKGDQVAVWRGDVHVGDVVLCPHPEEEGEFVIGRVIARTSLLLDTNRGRLKVGDVIPERDSQGVVEFYDEDSDTTDEMFYGIEKLGDVEHGFFEKKKVPFKLAKRRVEDGVFLLSDNRTYSGQDSRTFGEVDPASCVGVVIMRLRPTENPGADLGHAWLDIIH